MSHGWAVTNAAGALSTSAFNLNADATRAYLNDSRMDFQAAGGVGTTLNFDIDFGAAVAIAGFAILNHNFAPVGSTPTITFTGSSSAIFTSGNTTAKTASTLRSDAPYNKDHVLRFPSVTKRYWRLAFAFTASLTPKIGEVFAIGASDVTTLTRIKTYGHGEGEEYAVANVKTDSGRDWRRFLGGPVRSKVMPFADLRGTSERQELMAMFRATRGGTTPLLWIENDNATSTAATADEQECIYGYLQPQMGWAEPDYNLFDIDALELRSYSREVGS